MADSRISFFCLGVGIGTVVGTLFASNSNEGFTGGVKSQSNTSTHYLWQYGKQLHDQVEDTMGRGREVFGYQKKRVSVALEAGVQAYHKTMAGLDTGAS